MLLVPRHSEDAPGALQSIRRDGTFVRLAGSVLGPPWCWRA